MGLQRRGLQNSGRLLAAVALLSLGNVAQAGQCPLHRLGLLPRSTPANQTEGVPWVTIQGKAVCPVLGPALRRGLVPLRMTADGKGEADLSALSFLGKGPDSLAQVTKLFAVVNHTNADQRARGVFDPLDLAGSRGDHPGDSKILKKAEGTSDGERPNFDQARFDDFTRHASLGADGSRYLTLDDLGRGIAENLRADPRAKVGAASDLRPFLKDLLGSLRRGDPVGAFNATERWNNMTDSAGEFGLLTQFLGVNTRLASGKKVWAVPVDRMQALFKDGEFPSGWEARFQRGFISRLFYRDSPSAHRWVEDTAKLYLAAHAAYAAPANVGVAAR